MLAIAKLTVSHTFQQVEVFLNATVAVRAVLTRFGQCAAVGANFVGAQAVNIGKSHFNQLNRGRIQPLEIIRRMCESVIPIEPQPANVTLDGLDILLTFLARIGIVESQKRTASRLGCYTEVQANRHDVADMQIAVWFRRESSHNFCVLA